MVAKTISGTSSAKPATTKFSVRYGTVLYRLRTPSRRVGEVLSALAEGLSVGAAVRVFGHGEFTIRRWLTRAGIQAASLHERLFQNLKLRHVQLDELCTKTRRDADALWVWFAVDARTKIIPVLKVGPRTQPVAHAVVHALAKVLAQDCLPIFTSDGLKLYFYALTAHFGHWAEAVGGKHTTGKSTPGLSTDKSSNTTPAPTAAQVRAGGDASSALSAAPCLAPRPTDRRPTLWRRVRHNPDCLCRTAEPYGASGYHGIDPPHLGHRPIVGRVTAPSRVVARARTTSRGRTRLSANH